MSSTSEQSDPQIDPFQLQVNFTDTQLSHRFIRFEVPGALDYGEAKQLVQQYLIKKLQDPETTGCLVAKLQEDEDLVS